MTDGLENTAPFVATVEGALPDHRAAIGFGAESSLNGPLLSALATAHGGLYTRAGNGLSLEKFFSNAFATFSNSDFFWTQNSTCPPNQPTGTAVPFQRLQRGCHHCGGGWDNLDASLNLPGHDARWIDTRQFPPPRWNPLPAENWNFLRIPLPIGGERNGTWSVNVFRPGGGEFPRPRLPLRYFVNIIPTGGPRMSPLPRPDSSLLHGRPDQSPGHDPRRGMVDGRTV